LELAMVDPAPWFWAGFVVILAALLAFDLGVVGRQKSRIGVRESLLLTAGYVSVALLFGGAVFIFEGADKGLEYLTGYLLEKGLSVDNIFVFVLIFGHFQVPREYQHRVLFWGLLGALAMRAALIFAGTALLARLDWAIYVFAVIVIASGIRLLAKGEGAPDLEDNRILKFLRRHLRVTKDYDGRRFFVRRAGARYATPLTLTLVLIETSDLIFAFDSIPAIFGVTRDPFIIYTSNAFAILGLRALYFAVAGLMRRFELLHYGLAIMLILIGVKMIVGEFVEIPVWLTLSVTLLIIAGSVGLSLIRNRQAAASDTAS
jgi:tellurite resistance protein TerC